MFEQHYDRPKVFGSRIMREVRLKRAAALRQRANDLRIELGKRPHLAATLLDVIEELERKAEQLDVEQSG